MKSKDNTIQTLHTKFYTSRGKNKRIRRGVKYAPPRFQHVFKNLGKIGLMISSYEKLYRKQPVDCLMQVAISSKTRTRRRQKRSPRDNHCVQNPSPRDKTGSQKPHPRDIKLENISINCDTI